MEATEFLLGISKPLQQPLHPLESGMNTPGLRGHKPLKGRGIRRHGERAKT
jgi:hypothetical protein